MPNSEEMRVGEIQERLAHREKMVQELAQLVRSLIVYRKSTNVVERAKTYLKNHGLNGTVLKRKTVR